MVGQHLQGHGGQQGDQVLRGLRYVQGMVHLGRQLGVSHGQDRQYPAVPGLDLFHVVHDLVVERVLRRQRHRDHGVVDEGDGPVLHLPRRVTFSMYVADLFQL